MELPVPPPVTPMLARLARELPRGPLGYEPKWDGFRCLAFRAGDRVDLRSRHDRPFSRYFPEVAEGVRAVDRDRLVLDGELVVAGAGGLDFEALLSRLHPAASRVERLRRQTPASFIAFDLLGVDDRDLRDTPFGERRRILEHLLESAAPPVLLTPFTDEVGVAEGWLDRFQGAGIDGVVAKDVSLPYQPGKRSMVKVKRERTADCVVAGFRWLADRPVVSSLLLGLHHPATGELRHVGVATAFREPERRRLARDLSRLVVPLEGHPWEHGFLMGPNPTGRLKGSADRWTPDLERDWVPIRPELVCEVAYTQVDRDRFRHAARFRRWRPDRTPRSCSMEQLQVPPPALPEALRAS